jgi:hypothetical protein
MARADTSTWKCVMCGEVTHNNEVICYGCTIKEWKKQKEELGSITVAQVYFIEKKCLTKLPSDKTIDIILSVVPEYDYDIENLSCEQAKDITAKLLDAISEQATS